MSAKRFRLYFSSKNEKMVSCYKESSSVCYLRRIMGKMLQNDIDCIFGGHIGFIKSKDFIHKKDNTYIGKFICCTHKAFYFLVDESRFDYADCLCKLATFNDEELLDFMDDFDRYKECGQ